MNKWLSAVLFFTINFLIFLLPKLMTGAVSTESIIFWAVWVNSLFFLFLILPAKASYFFNDNKSIYGLSMDKVINYISPNKQTTIIVDDLSKSFDNLFDIIDNIDKKNSS